MSEREMEGRSKESEYRVLKSFETQRPGQGYETPITMIASLG